MRCTCSLSCCTIGCTSAVYPPLVPKALQGKYLQRYFISQTEMEIAWTPRQPSFNSDSLDLNEAPTAG